MSLDPSPDEARRLVERELARPEYPHPSLLDRFWDWLSERVAELSAQAVGSEVGILLALVAGGVVLAALLAALSRVGRERRAVREAPGVLDVALSARSLRERAEHAVREERYDDAVADATRALARRCVERGLLDDSLGRTSHEVLAELGERFPALADDLAGAADLFDRVVYGARSASRDDATEMLDLDDAVRAARPVAGVEAQAPLAVPR